MSATSACTTSIGRGVVGSAGWVLVPDHAEIGSFFTREDVEVAVLIAVDQFDAIKLDPLRPADLMIVPVSRSVA